MDIMHACGTIGTEIQDLSLVRAKLSLLQIGMLSSSVEMRIMVLSQKKLYLLFT